MSIDVTKATHSADTSRELNRLADTIWANVMDRRNAMRNSPVEINTHADRRPVMGMSLKARIAAVNCNSIEVAATDDMTISIPLDIALSIA